MTSVSYNDPRINYHGRWFDAGIGMQCSWQGGQFRFKISGVLSVDVVLNVKDPNNTYGIWLCSNVDKADVVYEYVTDATEIYTGSKTHSIILPDTGEHTVIVKFASGLPNNQWDDSFDAQLVSIDFDDTGALTEWVPGSRVVGFVGDSWMSAFNDWPMFLSDTYHIYPVAFGGATAAGLDAQINYLRSGVAYVDTDPVCDVVVVNSSVNDYNASVSLASFASSFASLIAKVRAQQPTATILLVQSPDNTGAGKTYSQYGAEMSVIAAGLANVEYVPNIDAPAFTWLGDAAHLDYASRVGFGGWIESKLDPYFVPESISLPEFLGVRTVYGTHSIPLTAAAPGDELTGPIMPTLWGDFKPSITEVVGDLPERKILWKSPGGTVYQVGE